MTTPGSTGGRGADVVAAAEVDPVLTGMSSELLDLRRQLAELRQALGERERQLADARQGGEGSDRAVATLKGVLTDMVLKGRAELQAAREEAKREMSERLVTVRVDSDLLVADAAAALTTALGRSAERPNPASGPSASQLSGGHPPAEVPAPWSTDEPAPPSSRAWPTDAPPPRAWPTDAPPPPAQAWPTDAPPPPAQAWPTDAPPPPAQAWPTDAPPARAWPSAPPAPPAAPPWPAADSPPAPLSPYAPSGTSLSRATVAQQPTEAARPQDGQAPPVLQPSRPAEEIEPIRAGDDWGADALLASFLPPPAPPVSTARATGGGWPDGPPMPPSPSPPPPDGLAPPAREEPRLRPPAGPGYGSMNGSIGRPAPVQTLDYDLNERFQQVVGLAPNSDFRTPPRGTPVVPSPDLTLAAAVVAPASAPSPAPSAGGQAEEAFGEFWESPGQVPTALSAEAKGRLSFSHIDALLPIVALTLVLIVVLSWLG